MRTLITLTAAVCAALWMPVSGRTPDSPLQTAAIAWDRGDYVTALTTYLQILGNSSGGACTFGMNFVRSD
jgi:hypothetical protein